MGTTADKLNKLLETKEAIRQAIINKGIDVGEDIIFAEYPYAIEAIESGDPFYNNLFMQRTNGGTNMAYLFSHCDSPELDLSNYDGKFDTSQVYTMSHMFSNCSVPYIVMNWNINNVTDMSYMFENCTSELHIGGNSVSLTNADYMFYGFTNNYKYIDISYFDFSNVTQVDNMFGNCDIDIIDIRYINIDLTKLNWGASAGPNLLANTKGTTLDLSNWYLNESLESLNHFCYWNKCKEINFTNWVTTNVRNMDGFFYYCTNLERLIMPDWDMTNTTEYSNFFYGCSKLKYIDLSRSNFDTIELIALLAPTKKADDYGEILVPEDTPQEILDVLIARYWKPIGPRIDMTSCEIFVELDEIKPLKSTKLYYCEPTPWYANDVGVEYVSSNESVAIVDKDTMTVISTGIEGTTEIGALNVDTGELVCEPITITVSAIDNYPNVVKYRLKKSNPIIVNGSSIDVVDYNSIMDMYTYDVGEAITSIRFTSLKELVKLNTSNVTTMKKMFSNCDDLTSLDLSDFDTSKVTDMDSMFFSCNALTTIGDVSNWNTSEVTNMNQMFHGCDKLKSLDLSNWDTSKVTNMYNMFTDCSALSTLNVNNFDVTNVEGLNSMFYKCGLISLDLSNWDTSKVEVMANLFYGCTKLKTLRLDNWNMNNVLNAYDMFGNCNNLTELHLDNCSNNTISKIINSENFPTGMVFGFPRPTNRILYCKESEAVGLTDSLPNGWKFSYVQE